MLRHGPRSIGHSNFVYVRTFPNWQGLWYAFVTCHRSGGVLQMLIAKEDEFIGLVSVLRHGKAAY